MIFGGARPRRKKYFDVIGEHTPDTILMNLPNKTFENTTAIPSSAGSFLFFLFLFCTGTFRIIPINCFVENAKRDVNRIRLATK
jgi:hypothetical protein